MKCNSTQILFLTVNPQGERSKTAEKRTTYLVNARGYAMRPGENGSPILAPNAQFLARNEISAKESQSVVYSPVRRVGIVFVLFVGVRAEETDEDRKTVPEKGVQISVQYCRVGPMRLSSVSFVDLGVQVWW